MTQDTVNHYCRLDFKIKTKMRGIYDGLDMSMRSYHKSLKMARTIADLNGREKILERDLMMAVGFRLPEISDDDYPSRKEKRK